MSGCKPPAAPVMPPAKVTVAQPQMGTVTNWDEFPGHIEAVETVDVRPRVSGYVESIHFVDGATVKAGDLLFVIDPKPFQADLERAQAEVLRAETRLTLSKNDLQRAESLRGTKAISDEEFDTRSQAVREGEAARAAARATEVTARLNYEYTQVKAPITGRMGRRLVTMGNVVQGSGMMPGTLLATLVSLDPVYCSFDAEESVFNRYRQQRGGGAGGKNAVPCEVGLAGEDGYPHRGVVDFFDNRVDERSGTLRLRATCPNPDGRLMPGMFARVRVLAGAPSEAMLVPAVAVRSDQGNKVVLVVNDKSVVEPRIVEVGRQHGASLVVNRGLTLTDRVVVNGLMMARPGSPVEVVPLGAGSPAVGAAKGGGGGAAAGSAAAGVGGATAVPGGSPGSGTGGAASGPAGSKAN
jgi:RND family efflux transporter MFP subunit